VKEKMGQRKERDGMEVLRRRKKGQRREMEKESVLVSWWVIRGERGRQERKGSTHYLLSNREVSRSAYT